MRIVRNLSILSLLLAAPMLAQHVREPKPASTCGDCTCDPGQCCKKSFAGGCECSICEPPKV